MLKKTWLLLICVFVVAAIGYAQSSQTGTLMGTVTMEDGSTIPGATVIASSSALVSGKMTAVTNENGVFRFANLPPGVYEISFQLEGFRTVIRKDIRVSVLQTFTVNASLKQEALQEAIVVTGKGPTVDTQRQTRAANMDNEFLKSVPATRTLASFVNMAPGMVANGGLTSAFGSGTMENSYALDGVNIADPTLNVQYVNFSMDMMEEVSVQAGGLSAEFGSTKGAMVNIVTKSGGNRLSGSASFFFNQEKLKSDNTKGTPLAGQKSGNKYEIEPDLSIGGPIIKNKLWFFANVGLNKSASYYPKYPYTYPYVAGTAQDPIAVTMPYPYLKLTLQPNEQNKFVFSFNYGDRRSPDRLPWWGATYWTKSTRINQTMPNYVYDVSWNHNFGQNLYTNFKVALVQYDLEIGGVGSTPYVINGGYNYNSGNWFRKTDMNIRNRYNVNADATTFIDNLLGTHELKIGGEAQLARVHWKIETVDRDPVTQSEVTYMYGNGFSYGYVYIPFDRKDQLNNFSGFLQDTWRFSKNLTINLGLRAEYNSLVWPAQNQNEAPITLAGVTYDRRILNSITPYKWTTLAPRAGLIFDLFGNNTTLIKASYSRYTAPNYTEMFNLAHPNGWIGATRGLDWNTGAPLWAEPWGPGTFHVGYKNYKVQAPYADEISVGFERELFSDWSLGARFIRKWDRNLIQTVDASQLDMDKLMATGERDYSVNWEPVTVVDPANNQSITFYNRLSYIPADSYIVNPPGAKRDYKGLEITLAKRFANNWSLNASYVLGKATGTIQNNDSGEARGTSGLYSNPNNWVNNDGGELINSPRHQLKLQAVVKGPLGINVSGYFSYISGLRWTRLVASRYLVSLNRIQTVYAEQRGSEALPATKNLDLRLEKAFKLGNVTLSAFADCFNVFNQARATSVVGTSNNPYQVFGEMLTINNPRTFQLGARIEFN